MMLRRKQALVGLVALAVLALAGDVMVRRTDSSPVVRTINLSAVTMAVDEQAGHVVMAASDRNGGSLCVLDAHTGTILRRVALRATVTPAGEFVPSSVLALDEPAQRAFVTTFDFSNGAAVKAYVNVVDLRNGTLVGTVAAMRTLPLALAVDQRTERVVVVNGSVTIPWLRGRVVVLDVHSGAVLWTHSVGEAVAGVAVDQQNSRAFVISQHTDRMGNPIGPGHVSVLDVASGHILRTIDVAQNPYQLAVAARSGRVFVLGGSGQSPYMGHVAMLDAQSGRLLRTVTAGDDSQALAVDEMTGRVFIMNAGRQSGKGSVTILDARTGSVVRTVAIQGIIMAMSVDTRHHHVFVAIEHRDGIGRSTGPGSVSMLDAHSGHILRTVAVGNYPTSMAVAASEARVFVVTVGVVDPMLQNLPMETGHVSVLDARNGSVLRTIPVGVAPSAIAVDERAHRAFVINRGDGIEEKGRPDTWRWVPGWLR
jgi:DNA-binding beta-propeller fold protein YncE